MPDLRIAVVGPESSGKTHLSSEVATWLSGNGVKVTLVAEQGRQLAQELPQGHVWSWREQRVTSLMHQAAEARAALLLDLDPSATVLLCDGTAATPLVWHMCAVRSRPHYDAGPPDITEHLLTAVEQAQYDLVLLTAPDLPWESDGIRDDPEGRGQAFDIYSALFPQAIIISGEQRVRQAIEAVAARLPK